MKLMILKSTFFTAFVLFSLGCETSRVLKGSAEMAKPAVTVDSDELAIDLEGFEDYFELVITDAASRYRQSSENAASKKQITILKNQSTNRIRDYVYQESTLDALLDTWIYCERLNLYIQSDEAKEYFGRDPVNAKVAFDLAATRIRKIAAKHIPEEQLPKLEEYVKQEAAANPVVLAGSTSKSPALSATTQNLQAVRNLVTLPLSPLFTFQKVNETSNSFQEFNKIAERFSDTVEGLPEDLQFEAEGLLLTFLEHPNVMKAIESVDQTSQAAKELTEAADKISLVAEN